MYYDAKTHEEYLSIIPEDQREVIRTLREVIKKNLPEGFEEANGSGMIGFVVPLSRYPKGYHTTPGQPLPFIGLAARYTICPCMPIRTSTSGSRMHMPSE